MTKVENRKAKIVTFYSPQGGTGKTSISVFSSMIIAEKGIKVLLVDMSIFGSIMSMMKIPIQAGQGISSVATFLDIGSDSARNDRLSDVIDQSITRNVHGKHLDILINNNPIRMETLKKEHLVEIIHVLKNLNYSYIVFDTTSDLNERNLLLLEEAESIILPCIQDVSCGWNTLLFKDVMDKCSMNKSKFFIIMNKCSRYSGFSNSEFENEIGYKIIGEIPLFVKRYQSFMNQGAEMVLKKGKNAKRCFEAAANRIFIELLGR